MRVGGGMVCVEVWGMVRRENVSIYREKKRHLLTWFSYSEGGQNTVFACFYADTFVEDFSSSAIKSFIIIKLKQHRNVWS